MKTDKFILTAVVVSLLTSVAAPQSNTVGLLHNDSRSFDGYTLFAPLFSKTTYLINNQGRLVHSWQAEYFPGAVVYLTERGHLLRTGRTDDETFNAGGRGGVVQEIDWDGNVVWEYRYSDHLKRQHHDVEMLPNGNVLMIAWEHKTAAEAIAAGRDPSTLEQDALWPDHIVEVKPAPPNGGEIVWEWHVWDHLVQDFDSTRANFGVVADHPELIDINYAFNDQADWNHLNAIDYNPSLDQIIVSSPLFHEIWIIDHSTTSEEAAGQTGGRSGKGGDLLYRWGHPVVYRRGTFDDQTLFFQHDAQWIKPGLAGAGRILIFNNGQVVSGRPFSSIDEIAPPRQEDGSYLLPPAQSFGPDSAVWSYRADDPEDFFSPFISGAQRLQNGNTLICAGAQGLFFEITPEGEKVWEYLNPVTNAGPVAQGDTIPIVDEVYQNLVFRAYRFSANYAGLAGRDLTPGNPIELDPMSAVTANRENPPSSFMLSQNYPNPFHATTQIRVQIPPALQSHQMSMEVFDLNGRMVKKLRSRNNSASSLVVTWDGTDERGLRVSSDIYFVRVRIGNSIQTKKMVLLESGSSGIRQF